MRILSWNVNHRAGVRAIPDWFVPAIAVESPGALVCTEYVRGPTHVELLKALRAVGLPDSDVTAPYHPGANCILIAAHEPLLGGAAHPPAGSDPAVLSGFAHAILEKTGIHVIAFRMPEASEMSDTKRHDCAWLADVLEPYLHEPAVFIADLDAASGDAQRQCADQLDALVQRGWRPASADVVTPKGGERRRHVALASPLLTVTSAEHSVRYRDLSDEASDRRVGIPDQAMVIVDVTLAA